MTPREILRLLLPIVLIVVSIAIRNKPRFQGIFSRWWVLLLIGIVLLAFRLYQIFYVQES